MIFYQLLVILILFQYNNIINCSNEPISHQASRLLLPGIADLINRYNTNDNHYNYNNQSITINFPSGTFKAYRPYLFDKLRHHSGISITNYIKCFNTNNLLCIHSDSKSGQSFWKSIDGKIIIKTIKHYEVKNLLLFIDALTYHMIGYNYNEDNISCIASIIGLYRIKLSNGKKKYFLISKNIYPINSNNILMKYDLKGSTIGRKSKGINDVYKDLDLIEAGHILNLGHSRDIVLYTIQKDINLLSKYNFMDYSLLVAIENPVLYSKVRRFWNRLIRPISTLTSDRGKLVCLGGDGLVYHFGVIDFLQKYSLRKRLETFWKGLFVDSKKISCTNPKFYANRFLNFLIQYSK